MLRKLLALTLMLIAPGCAPSSRPPLAEPPEVAAAQARVDQRLDNPAPPARLALCQDGNPPVKIGAAWECPIPPEFDHALSSDSALDQRAVLIGLLRKETHLRFELLEWLRGNAPAPSN